MKSDARIRLVTICDLSGKIMHSDHREGVKNLLTPRREQEITRTGSERMENTQ